MAAVIIGLALFFYFGFSSSRDKADPETPASSRLDYVEDPRLDAVAALAANDEAQNEVVELNAQTSAQKSLKSQADAEGERLDLSGSRQSSEQSPNSPARKLKSYNGIFDLTFDDVKFDLEPEDAFSADKLTDEIRQIDGQKIKIRGYIRPSFSQRGLKNFVFVRDNKECCFGPNAAIYDCMLVKLKKETTTDYTVRPVTVEGTFYLKPYQGPDGNTWAIYRMKNATVK